MHRKLSHGHFYGDVLRSANIAGSQFTETIYYPDTTIPKHSHESAYFCLVLQGNYMETYENKNRTCKQSALLFHPSGEVHANRFHNVGGRVLSIEVDPKRLQSIREFSKILDNPAEFHGGQLAWLTMRLYREFRGMDETSPLAIEGLILEILAEASRSYTITPVRKPPHWLERAKELIHAEFSRRLSLNEIAESVGVHPVHLARVFRKHYRCTIGEYVRQRRIEFACHQLSESDAPLVEVALAAGFSDQSHFTRTFKHYTGMTPAEFSKICHSR